MEWITNWCDTQQQSIQVMDMAQTFCDKMAPIKLSPDNVQRSQFRIDFVQKVVQKAGEVYGEFATDISWKEICYDRPSMATHALVQKHLMQPAVALKNILAR